MIPHRLELENFLSYREPAVLDFSAIHLACIAGANGAGKSSLLDAMTWALFGRSRSKSDDDLVNRLAQRRNEAAEVRLEFESQGGHYRVIRRKQAGKSVMLEFQALAGGRQWKTLNEGKVRETQAAIERLLQMNYETFVNASFLLQGRADEFTTKTAGRRKEVLADLLGVNRWDIYREAAANRRKETESQLLLLDGRLADIEQELDEEEERRSALTAAKSQLEAIAEQRAAQERLVEQLRRVEMALKQQRQLVENLAGNLERSRRSLAQRQAEQERRQEERRAYQELLDQAEAIAADFAAWQEAEENLKEWQQKANAYNAIQQEKRPHELTLERERSRLLQRQEALQNQAEQIASMEREKAGSTQELNEGKAHLLELTEQIADAGRREQAYHQAREKLQALQAERRLLEQEAGQLQKQRRRAEQLQQEQKDVGDNVQKAQTAVQELSAQVAAIAQRHQRHAAALAEMNTLQAEQPRLRQEMNRVKERLDRLGEESGDNCPLCGQTLTRQHRQSVAAELEREGKEMGARFRSNKERIAALAAEAAELESQLKQKERLERDYQTQQQRLARAEARLAEIEQAVAEWQEGPQAKLAQLEAALADDAPLREQEKLVAELAAALAQKEKLEAERQRRQQRVTTIEARLAEIERAISHWEESERAQLEGVSQQLAAGEIAPEAQVALDALEKRAAQVGYDPVAHQQARQASQALAEAPARQQALRQAQAAVKPLEDSLADLARQIAAQEEEAAELEEQRRAAEAQLEALAADGADLAAVEEELLRLRDDEIAANRRVGAAQQRLAVLDDLRRQRGALKEERAGITRQIQRLKLLEKACGRDGVQALLIEQALPDIQEDANELLARLTGGQMSITFDTQRKLKSADRMAETLDIHIGDNVGIRPYENYSGGEQFRVNFAIRLALSRLLAKRAGARLETLVIDEGFGSQDPYGQQRLIEAINIIQNDFARVLVITHINELQDAFPTRIEVEKGPAGSTIKVAAV